MSNDKHTPTPLTENEVITRHDKGLFLISSNEHDGLIETIATLLAEKEQLESRFENEARDLAVAEIEINTLRAEKAELIEALKLASTRFAYLALYDNTERNGVIPTVGMNDIDKTLDKIETK